MKMRVMSYNTQSGFANGRKIHNYVAQADHIAANNPDIVALQEVAINHPAGEKVDYPAAVAKRLGMEYCYAKAMDFETDNGKYGVAILSKYPMKMLAEIMLPVPDGIEPRVAAVARIEAPVPFSAGLQENCRRAQPPSAAHCAHRHMSWLKQETVSTSPR